MKKNKKYDLEISNNSSKLMRLSLVAKQTGVGIQTIVQNLSVRGYKIENSPNAKLNYEQIKIVAESFGAYYLLDDKISTINSKNELESENFQEFVNLGVHYSLHIGCINT
ncbi:MAG: hypothetical protein U5N85_22145 [Arcicella sp.]|nr:hypothetical protein [Arcicella sp.]